MRELAPQGILGNQIITRREFLTLAGISFIALQTDLNGISLFSPEITVQRLDYEKEVNNPFLARVIIDIGNFFVPDRPFMYSHRAGNSIEGINTAYRKGANLFDIDANDVSGTIYGEHGFILQANLFNTNINLVVDPNEGEISTVLPTRIEDLIKHIHSLSIQDNPLGVSMELKRGPFKEKTLDELVNLLYKYNMPAVIGLRTDEQRQNLRKIVEKKENI